jgi:hypothetical protein
MSWNAKFATGNVRGATPSVIINNVFNGYNERSGEVGGYVAPSINVRDLLSLSTFQSAMTTILSKFANHTDNSGSWDGQSDIPKWTEASMMTYLSESRLAVPTTRDLLNDWIMQQYRMINLLRYAYIDTSNALGSRSPFYKIGSSLVDWATAESNFTSASWNAGLDPTYGVDGTFYLGVKAGGTTYQKRGQRLIYSITRTLQSSMDFYTYATKGALGVSNFEAVGVSDTENQFHLYETEAEAASHTAEAFVSADLEASHTDPDLGSNGQHPTYDGSFLKSLVLILKYDGPNGFTYKDW